MSDSPASSGPSPHQELIDSLNRQSAVMERLADLLPQLIAQNQILMRALEDRDEREEPATYLDGTPR